MEEPRYTCVLCGQKFINEKELVTHLERREGISGKTNEEVINNSRREYHRQNKPRF